MMQNDLHIYRPIAEKHCFVLRVRQFKSTHFSGGFYNQIISQQFVKNSYYTLLCNPKFSVIAGVSCTWKTKLSSFLGQTFGSGHFQQGNLWI